MLSGSFCDPQGEQENGEVFRRVDTYVCASIHFSSTLRKNSDFFSINSNVKTFRQRNCHEGRRGLVIKWNVQFQKISIPPPPGISTQGVLIITCPLPRTFVILFMS